VNGAGRSISGARPIAEAVAWRAVHNFLTTPKLLIPPLAFPLLFFASFAGGLGAIAGLPGFDFPSGYTAFQFVFVLFQSAAFGGALTGLAIAADFESGFARRYLLAAPRRLHILLGYCLAATVRALVTWAFITAVAIAAGMQIGGSARELAALYGLAALVSLAATLWSAGVALRTRSVQSGPVMQLPLFLLLFLAPVFVPLELLRGWIRSVASVNPATPILDAGRGLLSGEPDHVLLATLIAVGLVCMGAWWASSGMRSAERG
jgi:ABC-2 type transport system permease protein